MINFTALLQRPNPRHFKPSLGRTVALVSVTLTGWMGLGNAVSAQSPAPLPAEIQALIQQMDEAASVEDLDGVMDGVSRDFSHADGLTYDTLEAALEEFWSRYDNLSYTTTVDSWMQDGEAIVVQSTTEVTGLQDLEGRLFQLTSTLTSEQRFEAGELVYQETLTEDTQVLSGENPPEVTVNLPETVMIGQPFYFDAIVNEPLGDRRLLGTAIEEPINTDGYLANADLRLELLPAGGLFKVGQAPALPEERWVTGVIIREDGMTLITRRIRFETR